RFALFNQKLPYQKSLKLKSLDKVRVLIEDLKKIVKRDNPPPEKASVLKSQCSQDLEVCFYAQKMGIEVEVDPYFLAWNKFLFTEKNEKSSFWETESFKGFLLEGITSPFLGLVHGIDRSGLINDFLIF